MNDPTKLEFMVDDGSRNRHSGNVDASIVGNTFSDGNADDKM